MHIHNVILDLTEAIRISIFPDALSPNFVAARILVAASKAAG